MLACLTLCCQLACAIGLGNVVVQSSLGQILRAQVPVIGAAKNTLIPSCIKPVIESVDGDYIDIPQVEIITPKLANSSLYILLTSTKEVREPAVRLVVEITCDDLIQRKYLLSLDYINPYSQARVIDSDALTSSDNTNKAQSNKVEDQLAISKLTKSSPLTGQKNKGAFLLESGDTIKNASTEQAKIKQDLISANDVVKVNKEMVGSEVASKKVDLPDSDLTLSGAAEKKLPNNEPLQKIQETPQLSSQNGAQNVPLIEQQNQQQNDQQKEKALKKEITKLTQLNNLKTEPDQTSILRMSLIVSVMALLFFVSIGAFWVMRLSQKTKEKRDVNSVAEQKKKMTDTVDSLHSSVDLGNLDPNLIVKSKELNTSASLLEKEGSTKSKQVQHELELPALEDANSNSFHFSKNRNQSVHIEEISDVTQEAEFWMSVNDPQRALEILEPQSADDNQATPIAWLYLLDLYKVVGDEKKYVELRRRIKNKFNTRVPGFRETVDPSQLRHFEDFPHLVATCCSLWNTDKIIPFLESLLADDRQGERVGFDLPTYLDILMMLSLLREFSSSNPLSTK